MANKRSTDWYALESVGSWIRYNEGQLESMAMLADGGIDPQIVPVDPDAVTDEQLAQAYELLDSKPDTSIGFASTNEAWQFMGEIIAKAQLNELMDNAGEEIGD